MRLKGLLIFVIFALILSGVGAVSVYAVRSYDCASVESYDLWNDECYFECETDEECAELSKQVEDEINQEYEDSKVAESTGSPKAPDGTFNGKLYSNKDTGTETKGTTYTVQPDGSLQPKPTASHNDIWNLFTKIVGKEAATKKLVSFEVFNEPDNDTAASVWPTSDDGKTWHMNVNKAFASDRKDFIHTLVHEYGHILTLSNDQVSKVSGACPRFELSEGCAKDKSYIQAFQSKFWSKYRDDIPENDGENADQVSEFYNRHKSDFVSEYASTNPAEDMAESWANFVLRSPAKGTSNADKKNQLFYEYPELVAKRDQIRLAIGADLLRRERQTNYQ